MKDLKGKTIEEQAHESRLKTANDLIKSLGFVDKKIQSIYKKACDAYFKKYGNEAPSPTPMSSVIEKDYVHLKNGNSSQGFLCRFNVKTGEIDQSSEQVLTRIAKSKE